MMPITTGVSYTSYTPETSQTEGVIRGNVTESTSSVASNFDVSTLGKNDFMKLLLAQMQNQDPLNPTDNTEFVAQLAQFSSLEQMTEMNSNLETTLTQNKQVAEAINNAMMINYFGKKISAESDSFFYDGSNPIDLQFALDGNVAVGSIEIVNADGSTVRTIPIDDYPEGENTVEWDGLTNLGSYAKPGVYSFYIDAYDILNNGIETTTTFSGVVDGISYKDGEAHLQVGSVLIPFESVTQITEDE